jgi:hypothetical protein
MTLTSQHINLLKQLAEREWHQRPPLPVGCDELEHMGYITAVPPTRGDLSFLIVQITDAGRRALAAAEQ